MEWITTMQDMMEEQRKLLLSLSRDGSISDEACFDEYVKLCELQGVITELEGSMNNELHSIEAYSSVLS